MHLPILPIRVALREAADGRARRYAKNSLDGTLLARYLHLDVSLQSALATATGHSRDVLLGDLHDFIHGTLIL